MVLSCDMFLSDSVFFLVQIWVFGKCPEKKAPRKKAPEKIAPQKIFLQWILSNSNSQGDLNLFEL